LIFFLKYITYHVTIDPHSVETSFRKDTATSSVFSKLVLGFHSQKNQQKTNAINYLTIFQAMINYQTKYEARSFHFMGRFWRENRLRDYDIPTYHKKSEIIRFQCDKYKD